jgi:hypothetical protein
VSAGLITASGTLCWFNKVLDYDNIDMLKHDDADKMADNLFTTLPVSGGGK